MVFEVNVICDLLQIRGLVVQSQQWSVTREPGGGQHTALSPHTATTRRGRITRPAHHLP